MQNISMQATIVHPLYELQLKGGVQDALNPSSFDRQLVKLGKRFMNSSEQLEKDISMEQSSMDIRTFIPATGFHPVSLIHRGANMLERAYRFKNPQMTEMQRRTRPRYTLNTEIARKTDEVFQEHIVPRLSLMDSEQNAYNQLMLGVNWNPQTLAQLPMTDEFADRAYNMLDAVDKETNVLKGPVGKRFQQEIPDANDAQAKGQPDWMGQMQQVLQAQQQMQSRQNQQSIQPAPFVMNRGPLGAPRLRPIDLRQAPNQQAAPVDDSDVPMGDGDAPPDGANPPIQADPGPAQQRILSAAAGKVADKASSMLSSAKGVVSGVAGGLKTSAGGLLTSLGMGRSAKPPIQVDPGKDASLQQVLEESKNTAAVTEQMKTPTPGGPTAGWYDKVKNKIKSLRENNDTGPMMVATINGKTAEKAKVSVYAALSKQVLPNQVGMEFADEDQARTSLRNLINKQWDGIPRNMNGQPKLEDEYSAKDRTIMALYNHLNAQFANQTPDQMDEEAEKFFGMPLDFTFKGRTPGMVNLMDLSVGAGLVDPRDMGMNDIQVFAMHSSKLDYPASAGMSGGLDANAVAILNSMSDQIEERNVNMKPLVDVGNEATVLLNKDVAPKAQVQDEEMKQDQPYDGPTQLIGDGKKAGDVNSDIEDEEAKMEMAGAKEKDVMKVDKKDEVVVEQIAADKAINEEKNKKDKPLAPAQPVRKSERLAGNAPKEEEKKVPVPAPPKKEEPPMQPVVEEAKGDIETSGGVPVLDKNTFKQVEPKLPNGFMAGKFPVKGEDPPASTEEKKQLAFLTSGLTEAEVKQADEIRSKALLQGPKGFVKLATDSQLTIGQLARIAVQSGSGSRVKFVIALLAALNGVGAGPAK